MSSTYPDQGGQGVAASSGGAPLKEQITDARERLADAGDAVRGEAAHFAEQGKAQIAETVEAKAETVTASLGVFADAVRKAADELTAQDQTFAAKLAGQAADGLQSFSRALAGKSPEDLLHAARDLGRDNPTAFLAASILAGVAIGRFARSSAEHMPAAAPSDRTATRSLEPRGGVSGDLQDLPADAFRGDA